MYSSFDEFIVFGDPFSTDIDVLLFSKYNGSVSNGQIKPLNKESLNELYVRLDKLGYDINKPIDIVQMVLTDNQTTIVSKGGKWINNIVNSTYKYHKQELIQFDQIKAFSKYKLSNIDLDNDLLLNMIRSYAKYIFDNDQILISDYKRFKIIKKTAYDGLDTDSYYLMVKYMKNIFDDFKLNSLETQTNTDIKTNLKSAYKTLIMKLTQIIILYRSSLMILPFIKTELIEESANYIKEINPDHIRAFLFRDIDLDNFSTYYETYIALHNIYSTIADDLLNTTNPSEIIDLVIDIRKLDFLNQDILYEFFLSPIHPTNKFNHLWEKYYGSSSINDLFQIKSTTDSNILNKIKPQLYDKLDFVDQRSKNG